ncbi:MAG: hypothetical protein U5K81_09630 [Trueperaceae bacterium]|nr:hypothetical protein [Trueperaceae bacterium]
MNQVEAKVLIPAERAAEFYALVGRWLAGETTLPSVRRGARRSRRSSGPSASSYAAIGTHLQDASGEETTLSFDRIEEIIGRALPASAHRHRAWWANTDTHSQALTWLSAGWKVESADLDAKEVTFVRD